MNDFKPISEQKIAQKKEGKNRKWNRKKWRLLLVEETNFRSEICPL